jgi:hypothetical protein
MKTTFSLQQASNLFGQQQDFYQQRVMHVYSMGWLMHLSVSASLLIHLQQQQNVQNE